MKWLTILCMIVSPLCWSAAPTNKPVKSQIKESYKDIIQTARNLSLQRDRIKATQTLRLVLAKEGLQTEAGRELLKNLDKIAGLFYTEKSQQLFELAESLRHENNNLSLETYNDALKLEEDNTTILKGLAKMQILSNDCKSSLASLQLAETVNPYSEDVQILKLQALSCLNRWSDVLDVIPKANINRKSIYLAKVEADYHLNNKDYIAAQKRIAQILDSDAQYPEAYNLLSRLEEEQGKNPTDAWKKYLEKCKSGIKTIETKYTLDPKVCGDEKNVQAKLQQKEDTEKKPNK